MLKSKDSRTFILLGSLTLATGFIIERLIPGSSVVNFVTGMMIGLSVTFNIKALFIYRAEKIKKNNS